MSQSSKNPLLAWIYLGLLSLIWGSSFIIIKVCLHTYDYVEIAGARMFFGSLFFVPIMWKTRTQVPSNRYIYLIFSALLGFVLPAICFTKAGTRLNSSLSGMLNSLSPLFTLLIGILFYGQPRRWLQIIGILIGLLGSSLLIFSQATGKLNISDPYVLFVVAAAFMYGTNINIVVKNLSHLPALALSAWTFVFIAPISIATLLTTDFFTKIVRLENIQPTIFLMILGMIGSGLAAILFNRTVQLASGLFASSVTYLIPIVSIGWGFWDHEAITLQQLVGMAVILGGIYLVNKK